MRCDVGTPGDWCCCLQCLCQMTFSDCDIRLRGRKIDSLFSGQNVLFLKQNRATSNVLTLFYYQTSITSEEARIIGRIDYIA